MNPSTHEGATLRAAFCIAFAAFLRIGEFTWSAADWRAEGEFHQWHMTRSSAQFHPTQGTPRQLLLTLPASKTDPFRRGITLNIAAAGDSACAVTALHHLVTAWPAGPHTPLFSNIPLHTSRPNYGIASFDRNWVVSMLRDLLRQEGVVGHYSGHSFRRGAATWAKQVGIPDEDIQLLGRWKSSAYKRYIEVHPEHILEVSRRLQTSLSPGPPRARPTLSPPTPSDIPDPPASLSPVGGVLGQWGVRAGARESPGRPLGWQPPGPSAVPGVVAAPLPRQRLSRPAAPRLRHSRKG